MATKSRKRAPKVYELQPCRPPSIVSLVAASGDSPMLARVRVCACTLPMSNSRSDLNRQIQMRRKHHVYAKIKTDRGECLICFSVCFQCSV